MSGSASNNNSNKRKLSHMETGVQPVSKVIAVDVDAVKIATLMLHDVRLPVGFHATSISSLLPVAVTVSDANTGVMALKCNIDHVHKWSHHSGTSIIAHDITQPDVLHNFYLSRNVVVTDKSVNIVNSECGIFYKNVDVKPAIVAFIRSLKQSNPGIIARTDIETCAKFFQHFQPPVSYEIANIVATGHTQFRIPEDIISSGCKFTIDARDSSRLELTATTKIKDLVINGSDNAVITLNSRVVNIENLTVNLKGAAHVTGIHAVCTLTALVAERSSLKISANNSTKITFENGNVMSNVHIVRF